MASITKAVTGRESLDDILGAFGRTVRRLDVFIGQRAKDADRASAAEAAAKATRAAATADIDRASRTKAKIADLVA